MLPGMQAAFIDIGLDRAAFLHVEDVVLEEDMDELLEREEEGEEAREEAARKKKAPGRGAPRAQAQDAQGQPLDANSRRAPRGPDIVVQVSKGPISTKGARVTSHISLPGRYVVYMPTVDHIGVSKRIGNEKERKRLREVDRSVQAAAGRLHRAHRGQRADQEAAQGRRRLPGQAVGGRRRRSAQGARARRCSTPSSTSCCARARLIDRGHREDRDRRRKEHERLRGSSSSSCPTATTTSSCTRATSPIFDEYGIEDEIARALSRKVPLTSGGYLIIDQAEALTAIDVNTGRFVGKGRTSKRRSTRPTSRPSKEIAYQLRFRNIGGLIVLDFIDMERQGNRDKVYRALIEALKKDKAQDHDIPHLASSGWSR